MFLSVSNVFADQPLDQLFTAAQLGDSAQIRTLVGAGTNVNSKNANDFTPLMISVNWNRLEATRTLLSLGANPNYPDSEGSALSIAVGRDTEIVKALINAGANVNHIGSYLKYSPLGLAAGNRDETFRELKKSGGYQGAFPNRIETVQLLIKAGANVNHIDGFRSSPLRTAIRVNNLDIAKLLLENGADVHQYRDDTNSHGRQRGNTILMEAIYWYAVFKKVDAIELLLDHGANPNDGNTLVYDSDCDEHTSGKCTWQGYTVLTYAAKNGYYHVVKLLLKHGADPALPRQDGKSAIEIARKNKHLETAKLIKEYIQKNN